MELKRRDVILSATAVFITWGYVTHWLPTFRYLPYAFVAGLLVAVCLFLGIILLQVRNKGRVDLKALYGSSNVAFVARRAWKNEIVAWRLRSEYHPKPVYPQSIAVSNSVNGLLSLILRDFVGVWYAQISKRPEFKNEVDKAIREALISILNRLLTLDLVGLIISRIVPIITTHMKDFYDAERAIRGKKLTRNITESEGLDLAIANKFRNGNLHKAASLAFTNSATVEQQYLRSLIIKLLPKVLPPDMLTSQAVNVLIQEIVACAVLAPTLKLVADPDTWHQILETYGRSVLQERKNVRKLRAALEQHAPQTPKPIKQILFPKLQPNDNERQFEKFIRAIRKCNTLSDARRFRSEVAIQLRKESNIEGQDPLYLRRLDTGKRMLDQRIAQLGQAGSTSNKNVATVVEQQKKKSTIFEAATLRDIMYNASGLSYFMEFMDRQKLMSLVQFWVVVDGIRNPLEDENDDHADDASKLAWTISDRNDIAQITEDYLSRPEVRASPMTQDIVKTFLRAGKKASNTQFYTARREIFKAQSKVYHEMLDQYFVGFKKSDLWYKFLAAEDAVVSPVSKVVQSEIQEAPVPILPPRPAKLPRPGSSIMSARAPDLRRAIASSSDIMGSKALDDEKGPRRSLDSNASSARAPLFEDDVDTDPMANSTVSVESDQEVNGPIVQDPKVVIAMQAALDDIMDERRDKESISTDTSLKAPMDDDSYRGSLDEVRNSVTTSRKDREKPSIASLGLIDAAGRRGVFEDDLFGDETKFTEDDKEDDSDGKNVEDEIHEAAPGDLGLAEAIDALTLDIERLVTQDSIVDSLTKKAELTNNAAELRILRKSKASLQREISRKELQRQQYIIQESDNSLYGRANVHIKSIMVGTEEDGREFAMYIVEVTRQAGEQMPSAIWAVARRYSEFHDLNKRLRARYPQIKSLEFPRRQVPMLKLQKDFLERRRALLEKYLQALLQVPAICRSRDLRAFLSQQSLPSTSSDSAQIDSKDIVSRIYNSVTDGMEDFLGNIPALDQLSVAGQNLIAAATSQLQATEPTSNEQQSSHLLNDEVRASAEAEAELAAIDMKDLEPFVKPICDLFLETFELNKESNWLRGRAVVLVLQQLFGGTVERKVRENARAIISDDGSARLLNSITELIWPGGGPRVQKLVRTPPEKAQSQKQAAVVLGSLIPDLVGSVVGRSNAQSAARRILAMFNNERLNTHLVYTIFDEIISIVFGEGVLRG